MTSPIEATIFELLAALEPGKSISPEQAARAVDAEGWRRILPQVRATAVGLAREGRLVITRHGKPADPDAFKGVYRLRLPIGGQDEVGGESQDDDDSDDDRDSGGEA